MYRSPFRKVGRQHSPLASAFEQILYRAEDIIEINLSRSGLLPRVFQKRAYFFKLFPSAIARVGFSHVCDLWGLYAGYYIIKVLEKDFEQVLKKRLLRAATP